MNSKSNMDIRPYLVVPKLIPQPTWGGEFITAFKGINDSSVRSRLIGQSYELSADTMLSTVQDSSQLPIEIGDPSTGKTVEIIGDRSSMFSLQSLIDQNPQHVLGDSYVKQYGTKMQILIKFTQAKGNSFQVHVRPENVFGNWKPKPESWYFFQEGKATLGLQNPSPKRVEEYKQVCINISHEVERIAHELQIGTKTPGQAKVDIASFIAANSPYQFVNTVRIPKDAVIDLSAGGIHHSWEEGSDISDGNIVYEVQLNVMDNDCTLRSFDKGKIADDGKIRPIHIDEYFTALNTDSNSNDPTQLIRTVSENVLFDTPYYKTKLVNSLSDKNESFRHVFVKDGVLTLDSLKVNTGASVFIPSESEITSDSACTLLQTNL